MKLNDFLLGRSQKSMFCPRPSYFLSSGSRAIQIRPLNAICNTFSFIIYAISVYEIYIYLYIIHSNLVRLNEIICLSNIVSICTQLAKHMDQQVWLTSLNNDYILLLILFLSLLFLTRNSSFLFRIPLKMKDTINIIPTFLIWFNFQMNHSIVVNKILVSIVSEISIESNDQALFSFRSEKT